MIADILDVLGFSPRDRAGFRSRGYKFRPLAVPAATPAG